MPLLDQSLGRLVGVVQFGALMVGSAEFRRSVVDDVASRDNVSVAESSDDDLNDVVVEEALNGNILKDIFKFDIDNAILEGNVLHIYRDYVSDITADDGNHDIVDVDVDVVQHVWVLNLNLQQRITGGLHVSDVQITNVLLCGSTTAERSETGCCDTSRGSSFHECSS